MTDELQALLEEHRNGFILGCLWSLIALLFASSRGFFKESCPFLPSSSISARHVAIAFGVFLGLNLFVFPVLALLAREIFVAQIQVPIQPRTKGIGWPDATASLMTACFVLATCRLFGDSVWRAIWRQKRGIKSLGDVAFGASSWLVAYPCVLAVGQGVAWLVVWVTQVPNIDQVVVTYLRDVLAQPILFTALGVLMIFVIPMTEELLFRGILQTYLRSFLGRFSAISVTSVIFALFHYDDAQGVHNMGLIASLCVFSLFLGWVYEKRQSLWASIGLHGAFNAISVIAVMLEA